MKTRLFLLVLVLAIFLPWVVSAGHGKPAQPPSTSTPQDDSDREHKFRLTSTTFENDQLIPASMVFNGQLGSLSAPVAMNRHSCRGRTPVTVRAATPWCYLTLRQTSPTGGCSTFRPRSSNFPQAPVLPAAVRANKF
jgi:hypothetical protein